MLVLARHLGPDDPFDLNVIVGGAGRGSGGQYQQESTNCDDRKEGGIFIVVISRWGERGGDGRHDRNGEAGVLCGGRASCPAFGSPHDCNPSRRRPAVTPRLLVQF